MADTAPAKVNPAARFNQLTNKLAIETDMTTTDANSLDEFIKGRLVNISEADDFASINAEMVAVTLPASKDMVGRTVTILDFALRTSTKEGDSKLKTYAIIKAADEDGVEIVFEGGGDNFVAGLVRMRDLYDFPYTGTLTGTPTSNGNVVIGWRFMDPKRPKIQ